MFLADHADTISSNDQRYQRDLDIGTQHTPFVRGQLFGRGYSAAIDAHDDVALHQGERSTVMSIVMSETLLQEMRRLQQKIEEQNTQLYNPVGLNILWPQKVAFLFVSDRCLQSGSTLTSTTCSWRSSTM